MVKAQITYRYDTIRLKNSILTLFVEGEKMFYTFCEATDVQIRNWGLI